MDSNFAKVYSTMLPILFVLNGYGIGSLSLGLGTILLVLFVAFSMLIRNNTKRSRDAVRPILLLLLFFTTTLIAFLFESQVYTNSVINNFLKMSVWATALSVLTPVYLNIDVFKSCFRKFCIFCTTYLFIQNIMWMFGGVFIPNLYTFGPIHPLYDMYSQDGLKNYIITTNLVRFGSILSEPSFYGHLMIVDLVLILFNNEGRNQLTKSTLIECVYISSGIVISTSTGAVIFLAIVWAIYFISGKNFKGFIVILLGIGIVYFVLFLSPLKNNKTISWFVYKLANMDTLGRVGRSYENLYKLTARQWITGVGLGNNSVIVDGYLNSITSIIISSGLIGFLGFLIFVAAIYYRGGLITKVLMIIYTLGSFQGAIAFSLYGMLYISIVIVMFDKPFVYQKVFVGGCYEQLQDER